MRRLIGRHGGPAWLLVALTLCIKLLVPTGFMPVMAGGGVTLVPCPEAGPVPKVQPPAAMPGMAMSGHHAAASQTATDHGADHGRGHEGMPGERDGAGVPCAFAGLAAPSLAAVDPAVLAIAIADILATAFRLPERTPARPVAHLRPPLRGPPATV